MIIDVWRPKFKTKDGKKDIVYYEKSSTKKLDEKKPKGWKFTYKCDRCGKISSMNTRELYREGNIILDREKQYCISCRGWISERKRNNTIKFNEFKAILEKEEYIVYTTETEFYNQHCSQAKVRVKCKNGHIHDVTWNNFVGKGRRCRKCYEENRMRESVKYIDGFDAYRKMVNHYTKLTVKESNIEDIDKRSRMWHLDHKFSICEGFENNIPPYIIGNECNLEMLYYRDNIRKRTSSSITKEELFKSYFKENYKWN